MPAAKMTTNSEYPRILKNREQMPTFIFSAEYQFRHLSRSF
jgi:hypothetical protein